MGALDISEQLGPETVRRYYREQLSVASANYYSVNGLIPGRWHGFLREYFNLMGPVDMVAFDRLAKGQHPHTGQQLIRYKKVKRELEPWIKDDRQWRERLVEQFATAMAGDPYAILDALRGSRRLPEPYPQPKARSRAPERQYGEQERTLIEMHEKAAQIFRDRLMGPEGIAARAYLAGRGITPELAAEFRLGLAPSGHALRRELAGYSQQMKEASGLWVQHHPGAPLLDRFVDRLMFPIQDRQGNVIAFAGRDLTDKAKHKYINSPGTAIYKKSETLFNEHRVRDATRAGKRKKQVVMVEGYMDAIAVHGAGLPVVATCGTAVTPHQIAAAGDLAGTVVFNLDSDDAGRAATVRSVGEFIAAGVPMRVMSFEGSKDAAEMIAQPGGRELYREWVKTIEMTQSGLEFLAGIAADEMQIFGDSQERAQVVNRMLIDRLAKAPEASRIAVSRELGAFLGQKQDLKLKKQPLGHRAAHDATFHAPKGVSLIALVAGDERVREAHQFGVERGADMMQRYAQARVSAKGMPENSGKWIAAMFDHDTARPDKVNHRPAPHLHTHTVIFNMSQAADGRIRPLTVYEMFRSQSVSKAVYRNDMAWMLRRAGYELEMVTDGALDIAGFSQDYLDHESLRHFEIKGKMKELGLEGRGHEAKVAHRHREAKIDIAPEALRAQNREIAARFGNQPERLMDASRGETWTWFATGGGARVTPRERRELSPEEIATIAREAVNYARERLREGTAVFDHFEVMRDALAYSRGRVLSDVVEQELVAQVAEGRFIAVQHVRPGSPGYRYTTPEGIRTEQELIERVLAMRWSLEPMPVTREAIRARFGKGNACELAKPLSGEQMWAVWGACTTEHQVVQIQGSAGVGKSFTLKAVRILAEENGFSCQGLCPTSGAVRGLMDDAGIRSETLQGWIQRGCPRPVEGPVYWIMDESSLTSDEDMLAFVRAARPGDRQLKLGDKRQHQSVTAGRAFEMLQEAGCTVLGLHRIQRQQDPEVRRIVELMRDGLVIEAVALLAKSGRIHEIERVDERLAAIAAAFVEDSEGTRVTAPDNLSRQRINAAVREAMRKADLIGEDAAEVSVMKNRHDVRAVDRKLAATYRPGDVVRYKKGSRLVKIDPKTYGTVVRSDVERNLVTVRLDGGRLVTYDPRECFGVTIYEQEVRRFAVGDHIQWTAPWRDKGISTRDSAVIESIDEAGNMRARLSRDGRVVSWSARSNRHIDYGYALTSHAAQWLTCDRMIVYIDTSNTQLVGRLINRTFGYVSMSRPREKLEVYTDNQKRLGWALSRERTNPTAMSPTQITDYREGRRREVGLAVA